MDAALKKGALLLVIVFVGYYMFTNPAGAAATSKNIADHVWTGLVNLFSALISFLNAVFA
ncbi:hypothetical protein D9V37_03860 [Nocardioides mangrovicus]|uniref:Uncharacterized protein n=1 Tax=Nocardioides mangrovicus TaxID=2478913 RepID=A0A3L8P768_9ACTN|nr:hypothetical protein [Nocardioides mangrovicus]RLV51065.1 hypothetical protein D9V37_03860 [Nocardioides mangrovicus]